MLKESNKLQQVNWVSGLLLIMLTITVAIPLTIKSFQTNGGTWGFGIIALVILLPLCGCLLFGIAGMIRQLEIQRWIFVSAHVVTIITGVVGHFILPVYPTYVVLIPIALATWGILSYKKYQYFLLAMIVLAISANVVLLKWEVDFGRTVPVIQLFQPDANHSDEP